MPDLHDLDLTSPGHSMSKLIVPNERAYMTSCLSLIIALAVSTSVSRLPHDLDLTSPGDSRSKTMAPNETS